MADNNENVDSGSTSKYLEEFEKNEKAARVNDLATRMAFGDSSADAEAKSKESFLKDIGTSIAKPLMENVGSLSHLASSGLTSAGLSDNKDKDSFASSLDKFGEGARHLGQDLDSEGKQARDLAAQKKSQWLESSGDHIGAALEMAKYKSKHIFETTGELAGGVAIPLLATAAGALAGGPVGAAASIAAFASQNSGNVSNDVYEKYKNVDDAVLKSTNPEYAANPTPENKDRIARAMATQAAINDAEINGAMGFLGPMGKIVSGVAGGAASNIIKSGLGNITSTTGLTQAAKIAAASKTSFYGSAIAKDTAMMVGQEAASTVNQNYFDPNKDKGSDLFDGVATSIGASLPGGAIAGAHVARGARKEAFSKVDAGKSMSGEVESIMARDNVSHEEAMAKFFTENEFKTETDAADVGSFIKTEFDKDGQSRVEAAKDSHITSVMDEASKRVMDGKSVDMGHAIDQLKEEKFSNLAETHFDNAKVFAKDEERSAKYSKAIDERKAKDAEDSINSGREISKKYASESKGESFEEYAAKNGVSDMDLANRKAYEEHRAPIVEAEVERIASKFKEEHKDRSFDDGRNINGFLDSEVNKLKKSVGKSEDFTAGEILKEVKTRVEPGLRKGFEAKKAEAFKKAEELASKYDSVSEFKMAVKDLNLAAFDGVKFADLTKSVKEREVAKKAAETSSAIQKKESLKDADQKRKLEVAGKKVEIEVAKADVANAKTETEIAKGKTQQAKTDESIIKAQALVETENVKKSKDEAKARASVTKAFLHVIPYRQHVTTRSSHLLVCRFG